MSPSDGTARAVDARPRWRTLARGLADLLLPRACACCRQLLAADAPDPVCGACWARLEAFPAPTCRRCGHPRAIPPGGPSPAVAADPVEAAGAIAPFGRCRWCERLPPTVRAVRSVARVDRGTAGAIVHALKYAGWEQVALGMGRRMARVDWPADVVAERTATVPIPLAAARERERGFNQSRLLAEVVARQWGIPLWDDVLRRTRTTRSQTQLTPSERARNVSAAFDIDPAAADRLRGAHLVLVDDVITTAATLNAAASALTDRGVRLVSYLTFGRAPDAGDRSAHASDPD